MPISSASSLGSRPEQMPAVVRSAETSGRFSGSKVMLRSESVFAFLMSLAVCSAVMEMEMALP